MCNKFKINNGTGFLKKRPCGGTGAAGLELADIDGDGDTEEYLADDKKHFFLLNQSVYQKYSNRILTYLSISIAVKNIDDMPVSKVYDSDTDTNLDAILESIENGEV